MAEVEGEFAWHKYDDDEILLISDGEFTLQTKEKNFNPKKGRCFLVPKGTLHYPKTGSSTIVLVFELNETKQYEISARKETSISHIDARAHV